MNITGLEGLVFGVEDMPGTSQYLEDYGLDKLAQDERETVFAALDGSALYLRHADDPTLPLNTASSSPNLREMIYGVADADVLDRIEAELRRDREVTRDVDGGVHSTDDDGYHLAFQVTRRHAFSARHVGINVPGQAPQREYNELGVEADWRIPPRKLSHVVVFTGDLDKAEKFYVERLDFRITDRFTGSGTFLRPKDEPEHHSLFLIKEFFPGLRGLEHCAFHVASPSEVLQAGYRFQAKGYQSFWGPGRHLLGSNCFWYFKSPLGGNLEYDADMDIHDDDWKAREVQFEAVNAQAFLFESRKLWTPAEG